MEMAGWLILTLFICLHNQLSSVDSIHSIRCLKNTIQKIDSKNEWLLFSASFTAKVGLATGKRFFLEVSFSSQQTEHRFF